MPPLLPEAPEVAHLAPEVVVEVAYRSGVEVQPELTKTVIWIWMDLGGGRQGKAASNHRYPLDPRAADAEERLPHEEQI